MTTASPEDMAREALELLQLQGKRIEALEVMLFQLAPHTVPVTDLPQASPPDTVAVAADETEKRSAPANPDRQGGGDSPAPAVAVRPDESVTVTAAVVLGSLDDVVWSISPDGDIVFVVAGAVQKTFGCDAAALRSARGAWLEALPPDARHAFRAALARLPATDLLNLEHGVGAGRWLHSRGRLLRDDDGRPLRVDGISTDITHRVRTRRGLFAVLEGVGPASGKEFLRKLVWHLADVLEVRAALVAVPDDPQHARTLAASIDRRLAADFVFATDGGLMEDVFAGGSHFVGAAARDLFPTDELLLRLRAEAVVAEPLIDSDGRFLGTIVLIDDRALRTTSADVRSVLRAVAPRVAAEVAPPVRHADLSAAVRAAAPLVGRIVGDRVALDITLPPVVPLARADANAVSLLLLNLVATARDATADAGTITIRTAAGGGGVALTVTNTGAAMPEGVRARTLEQVRAAGGSAEIESAAGWATSVRVTWPAASELRLIPAGHDVGKSGARPANPN